MTKTSINFLDFIKIKFIDFCFSRVNCLLPMKNHRRTSEFENFNFFFQAKMIRIGTTGRGTQEKIREAAQSEKVKTQIGFTGCKHDKPNTL
jgi:hypothetical protein